MRKKCTLFSWALKSLWMVTAAMKLKRCLLLGRKVMTNLDSVLKNKDITLPTKVHTVKPTVFPVVMYVCERWTIKAECQRIDAFELWCWKWLLKVPWTVMRSNQSILKETNPEHSLEGLMLKLQHFGHVMQKANLSEKALMFGKIEGKRKRGQQRVRLVAWHHWINGHEFEQTWGDTEQQESLVYCSLLLLLSRFSCVQLCVTP